MSADLVEATKKIILAYNKYDTITGGKNTPVWVKKADLAIFLFFKTKTDHKNKKDIFKVLAETFTVHDMWDFLIKIKYYIDNHHENDKCRSLTKGLYNMFLGGLKYEARIRKGSIN